MHRLRCVSMFMGKHCVVMSSAVLYFYFYFYFYVFCIVIITIFVKYYVTVSIIR